MISMIERPPLNYVTLVLGGRGFEENVTPFCFFALKNRDPHHKSVIRVEGVLKVLKQSVM